MFAHGWYILLSVAPVCCEADWTTVLPRSMRKVLRVTHGKQVQLPCHRRNRLTVVHALAQTLEYLKENDSPTCSTENE